MHAILSHRSTLPPSSEFLTRAFRAEYTPRDVTLVYHTYQATRLHQVQKTSMSIPDQNRTGSARTEEGRGCHCSNWVWQDTLVLDTSLDGLGRWRRQDDHHCDTTEYSGKTECQSVGSGGHEWGCYRCQNECYGRGLCGMLQAAWYSSSVFIAYSRRSSRENIRSLSSTRRS